MMKRLTVLALSALLVMAFTMPAAALEAQFGGYWRTRAYSNQNFSGDDCETSDLTRVDTRTRIYLTAVLNDNLKFVNKFEFNSVWGDQDGGDIGADGNTFRVKNSYVDFDYGCLNAKLGAQGFTLARGFLFDDDFSGAVVSYNDSNSGISVPFIWMKTYEGNSPENGLNKRDLDYYIVAPSITLMGKVKFNPYLMYVNSGNAQDISSTLKDYEGYKEVNIYYGGFDANIDLGAASLWCTAIYQGGKGETASGLSTDYAAYLAAAGGSVNIGIGDVHGKAIYGSGDDDKADDEITEFTPPKGRCYYWSEIMGYGTFDAQAPKHGGDGMNNKMIGNVGATISPMKDLSVSFDAWYAALVEGVDVNGSEENELGIELDLAVKYKLIDGLTLDVVGAYLLAGDALNGDAANDPDREDENPFEVGSQLSLSF